jgi:hypothetical protein
LIDVLTCAVIEILKRTKRYHATITVSLIHSYGRSVGWRSERASLS